MKREMMLFGKENALALCMSVVVDAFLLVLQIFFVVSVEIILTSATFSNRYIGGAESEGHFALINQACSM